MRLTLQTLICCVVVTAALPVDRDAARDADLRRRLRVWMKTRVHTSTDGDIQTLELPSSSAAPRHKRSAMPGCLLFACSYHELLHRLYQIHNKSKDTTAPVKKMGSGGYGRRRRSVHDVAMTTRMSS